MISEAALVAAARAVAEERVEFEVDPGFVPGRGEIVTRTAAGVVRVELEFRRSRGFRREVVDVSVDFGPQGISCTVFEVRVVRPKLP